MLKRKSHRKGLSIGYLPVAHVIQYLHEGNGYLPAKTKYKGKWSYLS